MAPDGEEQDAYIIGVDEPVKKFTGKVVAIIHRKDDIEDKVSVSDVTPCKINDDCLHCCPSVRQQFTVLA